MILSKRGHQNILRYPISKQQLDTDHNASVSCLLSPFAIDNSLHFGLDARFKERTTVNQSIGNLVSKETVCCVGGEVQH